ncbi:MAG TPA: copper-binding protein [Methylomirabilota bacterium]|nr:copper-binding protein [Methylomirabilota bacterium]
MRGELVARPSAGLILVRHDPIPALGMEAMELMAIDADPALLDTSGARVGDRVRLAVRPVDDRLILIRIERLPD